MLYYIRIVGLFTFFITASALGIVACLFRPFHPDNTRLAARVYSKGGAAILGIKIRRHNYSYLRKMVPCVYVVNHQHNFDLFITGKAVAPRTVTLGKSSLKRLPFFGQLYWLAGNLFIDRQSRSSSRATISTSTYALTKKNTSIWVFAEGTRNKGENLLPFKKGAFVMAIEAGVPIVPICISSYVKNMDLRRLKSGVAEITVLPPISTENLTKDDLDSVMKQCWDKMKETIDAMDKKVYALA